MYAYQKSHFAEAADAALLHAATQNVLGAFRGDADQLFGDVLAVLQSTLGCRSVGVRLMDGRRLEQKPAEDQPTDETLEHAIARVVRDRKAVAETIAGDGFAGAPIFDGAGGAAGCLFATSEAGRAFAPDDLAIVERFARIASREFDLISATYTDPVTGCMSQWAFDALLGDAREACDHRDRGVAAIGIDGLDNLVEAHGRQAVDAVLRALAQACRDTFRRTDLIARLGSPRLVVLLCSADDAIARHCVERLRVAIDVLRVPGFPDIRLTISAGYTGAGPASLAHRVADAEKASYAAARMGGNRAVGVEDLRAALRVFKDRQG